MKKKKLQEVNKDLSEELEGKNKEIKEINKETWGIRKKSK